MSQLRIGMLSIAEMGRSQRGHRDRGEITDKSLGHLVMQTFKNEPTHAPMANASSSSGQTVTDEAHIEEFLQPQRH
jgi:hypothetical protein